MTSVLLSWRWNEQVQGYAEDGSGRKLATLIGKWSEHLHLVMGDPSNVNLGDEKRVLAEAQLLWKANARSEHCGKYKFTPFCVTLNELTPQLRVSVSPLPVPHMFSPFCVTLNELTPQLRPYMFCT